MLNRIIRLKLVLSYILSKSDNYLKNKYSTDKKKIIVALAANYGNLGDVAITYAQTKFLKEQYPNYEVIEFNISDTFTKMKSLKKIVTNDDIITIVGGGNISNLYDDIEFCRQFIIKMFPENRIVSFPQTIFFTDDSDGRRALKKCEKVYKKHKDFHLILREEKSYKLACIIFKNKCYLTPDIVFSLKKYTEKSINRTGIMFSFRDDKEKKISKKVVDELWNSIKGRYPVIKQDTHIGNSINDINELYKEFKALLKDFCKSKLIITDRLHGMIFSYITNTPCIVFSGSNSKIEDCYKWISGCEGYLLINKFPLEEMEKVISIIDRFYNEVHISHSKDLLNDKYDIIKKILDRVESEIDGKE